MLKLITPYASSFGKVNIVIKHFPDTESYVQIPQIKSLKNKKVTIYHRLYPEQDKRIFELLLILAKVKTQTKNIELFIPYLPYARQDKENKTGEAVSADILCNLLKSFGVNKLITYDCHFLPRPGNFTRAGLKIENKSAGKELVAHAKKYFSKNKTDSKFLVISPDEGASYFTENAQGHTGHILKKVRKVSSATDEKTGIHADIDSLHGEIDVKDKNICILDDIISTGGTIVRAVAHLKSRGAKEIIVGATHGVFAGINIEEKILNTNCNKLFISDSILKADLDKKVEIVKLRNF